MRGRDSQGAWDGHVHTALFKMDNQQGPTVQHRELCLMSCGSLDGSGVWGRMDTCICMAESLSCSPETTTTLLIGDPPIQNKKFKVQGEEKCLGTKEACKYLLKSYIWHMVTGAIWTHAQVCSAPIYSSLHGPGLPTSLQRLRGLLLSLYGPGQGPNSRCGAKRQTETRIIATKPRHR